LPRGCGPQTIEHVVREFEILTDEDGLVRLPVPPQSLVRVMTTADGDYEDEEMVEDVDVTDQVAADAAALS
jgi:hypothetical protein